MYVQSEVLLQAVSVLFFFFFHLYHQTQFFGHFFRGLTSLIASKHDHNQKQRWQAEDKRYNQRLAPG